MTPDELQDCLDTIGWMQKTLANRSGYDKKQVRRWLEGAEIPEDVANRLWTLADHHRECQFQPRVDRRFKRSA